MKGREDGPDASRPEELWAKWIDEGGLPRREEEELVQAVIADPGLRDKILQDQRIDGALTALARKSVDAPAFARQFVQRVGAERDGASFVSSVERRMRNEAVAGALGRGRAFRLLPWLLIPVAAGAVALFFSWRAIAVVLPSRRRPPGCHPDRSPRSNSARCPSAPSRHRRPRRRRRRNPTSPRSVARSSCWPRPSGSPPPGASSSRSAPAW